MRTTLSAVSAIALLAATPVAAADAYSSAKDPVSVSYSGPANWTGFYLGVNGGWGEFVDSRDTTLNLSAPPSSDVIGIPAKGAEPTGFLFGGQIGYLYQVNGGNFVIGGEFSFDGTNIEGTTTANPQTIFLNGVPENIGITGITTTMTQKLDWIAAATPVVGITFGNAMAYAKGGLAFGQVQNSLSVGEGGMNLLTLSRTSTDTGWTAGGGLAYHFTPNWIFSIEYDYYDLGEHSMAKDLNIFDEATIHAATTKIPENFSVVKASVNYQVGSVYQPLK